MTKNDDSLLSVYKGWDGYQQSLLQAIKPLSRDHLAWRPASHLRSVGELIRHIALGRIDWFLRMKAPNSLALASQIEAWESDQYGNQYVIEDKVVSAEQVDDLLYWLEASWQMIESTLTTWKVNDLKQTYEHVWRGNKYEISYQWTIWRILAHDVHHGGELVAMLGMQGLKNFELGDLGGQIIEPPLVHDQIK